MKKWRMLSGIIKTCSRLGFVTEIIYIMSTYDNRFVPHLRMVMVKDDVIET